MNWLYFFMGVTAAWVFMGVGIFVFDLVAKPRKNNRIEDELLKFWESSNLIGQEKVIRLDNIIESLRDISLTMRNK